VSPQPPFLVFPDQVGGFLVFDDPLAVFAGADLAQAESLAQSRDGWLAGGLEYGPTAVLGNGWWGVFSQARGVTLADLEGWADPGPVLTGALSSPVTRGDYGRAFGAVRRALEAGTTYQVNLTFPVEGTAVTGGPFTWRSALRLWLDLIAAQGREASFAVFGSVKAPGPVLVSASPELFFHREGEGIEARPMKGTSLRHADPGADGASRQELATSPKCRAENLMVTDMLRNDLGRLAVPGGVTVPRLFDVEAYPTVWQMTSTVRAVVPPETSLTTVMTALFPCASITGAPKVSTQHTIAAVEPGSRGWYTGTLGWHRPGSPVAGPSRSRFSVLIRTLVFGQDGAFRLGVGGGVVWDSTDQGEWDEAWAKTRFLGPTVRTFSLTEAILWEPGPGYFLLEEHERRLRSACEAWGGRLDPAGMVRALDAEVARLAGAGVAAPYKLRVLVDPEFVLSVQGEPLPPMADVLTVALATRPFGPESLLWRRFKTSNRRVYDEARVPGADQTLHFNERGELTESTSMNLVLERDGRMLTPALSAGLLDGTYRSRLVALGELTEAVLTVDDLRSADRIWLVNSVRRWKSARLSTTL